MMSIIMIMMMIDDAAGSLEEQLWLSFARREIAFQYRAFSCPYCERMSLDLRDEEPAFRKHLEHTREDHSGAT